MLVFPGRQGAAVRPIASPSATGSSGTCWFSQRGREQWCVLVLPAEQEGQGYISVNVIVNISFKGYMCNSKDEYIRDQ